MRLQSLRGDVTLDSPPQIVIVLPRLEPAEHEAISGSARAMHACRQKSGFTVLEARDHRPIYAETSDHQLLAEALGDVVAQSSPLTSLTSTVSQV